jgi:hypothetical protein
MRLCRPYLLTVSAQPAQPGFEIPRRGRLLNGFIHLLSIGASAQDC